MNGEQVLNSLLRSNVFFDDARLRHITRVMMAEMQKIEYEEDQERIRLIDIAHQIKLTADNDRQKYLVDMRQKWAAEEKEEHKQYMALSFWQKLKLKAFGD